MLTSPSGVSGQFLSFTNGCVTGAGSRRRTCNSFPDNGRALSPLAAVAGPICQVINPLADTPRPRSPHLSPQKLPQRTLNNCLPSTNLFQSPHNAFHRRHQVLFHLLLFPHFLMEPPMITAFLWQRTKCFTPPFHLLEGGSAVGDLWQMPGDEFRYYSFFQSLTSAYPYFSYFF